MNIVRVILVLLMVVTLCRGDEEPAQEREASVEQGASVEQEAAVEQGAAVERRTVSFLALGAGGRAALIRSRGWVERNFRCPVRTVEGKHAAVASINAVLEMARPMVREDDLLLIVLAVCDEGEEDVWRLDVEGRVAVINARALEDDDVEKMARRFERLTLRAAALLIGMDHCRNPRCCLYDHQSLLELDQLGRGFCPPCMIRQGAQFNGGGGSASVPPLAPPQLPPPPSPQPQGP